MVKQKLCCPQCGSVNVLASPKFAICQEPDCKHEGTLVQFKQGGPEKDETPTIQGRVMRHSILDDYDPYDFSYC